MDGIAVKRERNKKERNACLERVWLLSSHIFLALASLFLEKTGVKPRCVCSLVVNNILSRPISLDARFFSTMFNVHPCFVYFYLMSCGRLISHHHNTMKGGEQDNGVAQQQCREGGGARSAHAA